MKKFLVATSAFVVAAPAFANDVTLSGALDFSASTEDAAELSTASINTLSIALAAAGDVVGGNITLGVSENKARNTADTATVTSYSIGATGYDVYADTGLGKFNIGTSTGTMTDNDLTELEVIGNTGTVAFASGVTGVTTNGLGTYLIYSNSFGPMNLALTWGDDGMITSVGGSFGGFDVDVDSSDAGSVANLAGAVGPVQMKLEADDNSNYDLVLGGQFGDYGVQLGTNSNDDVELGFGTAIGGMGVELFVAEVGGADYSGVSLTTAIGGMATEISFDEAAGTSTASIEVTVADGVTLNYGGASGSEDLTVNVALGF